MRMAEREMATIERVERQSTFLSGESCEVKLSCGHKFTVERQLSVPVGDDFKRPIC